MPTYNHENFISEAINGVLIQKTTFPFKLIIGEDHSTDNTANIIREYIEKYPDIVYAIFNTYNKGAVLNSINLLSASSSKYIAICDGDDYWTDPYKLQKQVDFLEANPNYSFVGHHVKILYNLDGSTTNFKEFINNPIRLKDTVLGSPIHPSSFVALNNMGLPQRLKSLPACDDPLICHWASYGLGHSIPEYMSVYRLSQSGTWSVLSKSDQEFIMMRIRLWIFSYYRPLLKTQAMRIGNNFKNILKTDPGKLKKLSLRSWLALPIPLLVFTNIVLTNQIIKLTNKWLKKSHIKTYF
jgi:glycosyltransferase involved in cell wall biosynthesis